MRIGINCLGINEKMGGIRQYVHRLSRELLLNDHDNEYIFFHSADNVEDLDKIGVDRWREGALQVRDHGEILSRLGEVDVYFCPMSFLWPRPLPVASVVQLADIQEVYYPQFFTSYVLDWRKKHYPGSTRLADAVVTLSEFSRQSIIEHHNLVPDKVFVAHLTADEFFNEAVEPELLSNFHLPDRFLLFPANHWQHKNHDALLKALVILKTNFNITISAVMTGHEAENGFPLLEKISEYGLAGQVHVLGYLTAEEIRALYRKATLLCFPSLFEGFGMPVLEAMVSGCPVTCSDATSLPEICGDAALYFNPNEPTEIAGRIKELWESETLRQFLVARGRERARKFSATNMAAVHLKAFQYAYDAFGDESREMYRQVFYNKLNPVEFGSNDCERVLESVLSSRSWRLTAPLRWLGDKSRRRT